MASQGEREPGVVGMCSNNLESMARDGTCNFNQWGSSTPYSEHGLCRQKEPHNGGMIAPRRGTERAAILSATNGTTRGECFQQLFQAARARQAKQADIVGLRTQLEEEWKTKLAEIKKSAHDLMDDMDAHKKAFKSDMQSLQAGIRAITCRTRHEVTERKKLNGVTETCTRHIETKEVMGDEVTELAETREMGMVEERLHGKDGVKEKEDEHTHGGSGGQWGRARGMSRDPVQAAGWPSPGTRGVGSMPP